MSDFGISQEGLERILKELNNINQIPRLQSADAAESDIVMNKEFIDFIMLMEIEGFIEAFDYIKWLEEEKIDLFDEEKTKTYLSEFSISDIKKLILSAVRLERFHTGLLNRMFLEGDFKILEKRLLVLKEN